MAVAYGSLPFAEAIAYLRRKVEIPTARWNDISGAAHDRFFMVAGAAEAELIADLHEAVGAAIAEGRSIGDFRKDFEAIVARRGWTGWTGEDTPAGRAWRTRVIYATNLRTSHAAGRYRQMKAISARRPYWRYRHNDTVVHPRRHHLAWDGTVLRHDDPWWDSHYTPNGWNCFPGDVAVRCAARLGLKTWYAGEFVELRTASGGRLTVTANHPVLTRNGWIAAQALQEGDELVGAGIHGDAVLPGIVDHQQPPARAEELFQALAAQGLRVAPMTADDFHGDALLRKPEIHVAGSDRALMDVFRAAAGQDVRQLRLQPALGGGVESAHAPVSAPLLGAVAGQPILTQDPAHRGLGDAEARGDARLTGEPAAVERERLPLGIGIARVGHRPGGAQLPLDPSRCGLDRLPLHALSLRAAAQRDSCAAQGAPKATARAPGLVGELLKAGAGAVALDKVVEIRKFEGSDHVYDFVTTTGLIVAGGVVVSNCRCYIETLAPRDLEREGITPATAPESPIDPKTGAPVGIDKGWDHAPGANVATPLRDLLGNTLARVPAPIGAAMARAVSGALAAELDLAWKDTLDRWLEDPLPRGRTAVVGALQAPTLEWLRAHGYPVPPTAEITIADNLPAGRKQARHEAAQNALTLEEWRALPGLLRSPGGLYRQRATGRLVYVSESLGPTKTVVEIVPRQARPGDLGQVVTAFRVSDLDVAGAVKGREWEVIEVAGLGGSRTRLRGK